MYRKNVGAYYKSIAQRGFRGMEAKYTKEDIDAHALKKTIIKIKRVHYEIFETDLRPSVFVFNVKTGEEVKDSSKYRPIVAAYKLT